MKTKNIYTGLFALLVISILGISSVSAYSMDGRTSGYSQMDSGYYSQMNSENMMNHDFSSGKEFGQHVSENNYMFDGNMNPGVHHRGYSTFVR